jgi:lipoprotein-releasing system permease protein
MFIKTGMMLGVIGTMLGLVLGVVAAENLEAIKAWIENITGQEILVANIYFLSTLPTKLNLTEVVVIVLASLLISLLATIYPAIKAASTQPAEALRHG